jgi:copper chaperone NosL
MTPRIRWTVACAALCLSAAYAFPLWRIELVAPQYPEGLGMLIRVNAIDGFKEGDLQSINGLNHYIGMAPIDPASIPELRFMPIILAALIVTGVVVAAVGRRGPFVAWSVSLGLVFLAGMADFWKWGHEYGHNLSPTAIIKVPGMTYQPPLIGSKKLLNFTATSWPDIGGWILIVAAVAVAIALFLTLRERRAVVAAAVSLAAACGGGGPRAIVVGEDSCAYCRMMIVDPRYGGVAVTNTGRTLTFDSIECLTEWARTAPPSTVRAMYVIDVQHPGALVRTDSAGFLTDVLIRGPMGRGTVAFATPAAAEQQRAMLGGRAATWSELLAESSSLSLAGAER